MTGTTGKKNPCGQFVRAEGSGGRGDEKNGDEE